MKDLIDLHEALKTAGFAVTGLSGRVPNVEIVSWEGEPSKEIVQQANDFVKTFDWATPTDVEIKDRVSRLTAEDKQKVLDQMLLHLALENPKLLDTALATVRSK